MACTSFLPPHLRKKTMPCNTHTSSAKPARAIAGAPTASQPASASSYANHADLTPPDSPHMESEKLLANLHLASLEDTSATLYEIKDEPEDKNEDEDEDDNCSTDNEFVSGTDSDDDDGVYTDSSEVAPRKEAPVMNLPSSIPDGIDVYCEPITPTYNLIIIASPTSLFFAVFFINCKFEGPVTFYGCIISNTTFTNCTFRGSCRFDNVAFRDVQAIDCTFDNTWLSNRNFIGEQINEINDNDRLIDGRLGNRDTSWLTDQADALSFYSAQATAAQTEVEELHEDAAETSQALFEPTKFEPTKFIHVNFDGN